MKTAMTCLLVLLSMIASVGVFTGIQCRSEPALLQRARDVRFCPLVSQLDAQGTFLAEESSVGPTVVFLAEKGARIYQHRFFPRYFFIPWMQPEDLARAAPPMDGVELSSGGRTRESVVLLSLACIGLGALGSVLGIVWCRFRTVGLASGAIFLFVTTVLVLLPFLRSGWVDFVWQRYS